MLNAQSYWSYKLLIHTLALEYPRRTFLAEQRFISLSLFKVRRRQAVERKFTKLIHITLL